MNRRDDQSENHPTPPATGDTVPEQRVPETKAPSGRVPGQRGTDAMLAAGPPPAPPAPGAPPSTTDPDRHGPVFGTGDPRRGTDGTDPAGAPEPPAGARTAAYGAGTEAGHGAGTEAGRRAGSPSGRGTGAEARHDGGSPSGRGSRTAPGAPRAAASPRDTSAGTAPVEQETTGHTPAAPVAATPLSESPLSAPPPGDTGATGRSEGNAPLASPAAPRGQEPAVTAGRAERADLAGRAGHAERAGHEGRHAERAEHGSRRGRAEHDGRPEQAGGQHGERHDSLLADRERDRLDERLHHALAHFVDEPRGSVEEADAVLGEAGKQLVASLEERRRALREHWHRDPETAGQADTEELRQTLRDYREVTRRLLGA